MKDPTSEGLVDRSSHAGKSFYAFCRDNPGREWEVRVRCIIGRVLDVRLAEQDFQVQAYLETSWLEPKLKDLTFSKNTEKVKRTKKRGGRVAIYVSEEMSSMANGYFFVDDQDDDDDGDAPNELNDSSWGQVVDMEEKEEDIEVKKQRGRKGPFDAPGLIFTNCIEMHEESDSWTIFDSHRSDRKDPPVVLHVKVFTGRFQEPMELTCFPFDAQPLAMSLCSSWGTQDDRCVKLVQNLNPEYWSRVNLNANTFAKQNQYVLYPNLRFESEIYGNLRGHARGKQTFGKRRPVDYLVRNEEFTDTSADRHELFSGQKLLSQHMGMKISMRVDRRGFYWVLNVFLPLGFLTLCSFGSLAITPEENLGDRASITLTVLLTLFAIKIAIAERIPEINYLTLLDQ